MTPDQNMKSHKFDYKMLQPVQQSRKPKPGWRQLNFKYMMCVPSAKCASIVFIILFLISLILGSVLLSTSYDIIEYRKRYDDICTVNSNCTVTAHIPGKMTAPIFMYYELHNYYQNHRKYVKSSCQSQLEGDHVNRDDCSLCDPLIKVRDYDYPLYNLLGQRLNNSELASPCGLIAASNFQDRFQLFDGEKPIKIESDSIAWFTDNTNKYKNSKNYKETQFIDVEDQHFKVWMRVAATSDFRKLYGKISEDLYDKDYSVLINNILDVHEFDGEKWVIFTTVSVFGGKNLVLGWGFLVCALISAIWACVFINLARNLKPISLEERFNLVN